MQTQAVMDALSEFLMVEQCGLQLYRVALSRAQHEDLRDQYEEFLEETDQHRTILVELITKLGGDPDYVSPTARVAQVKASALLDSALLIDGMSPAEIEANDLENVLLAETKDQADWVLLSQLAEGLGDDVEPEVQQALSEAVAQVGTQEDEHLGWARTRLAEMRMSVMLAGPAPSPERWQARLSGPIPPISEVHPAPIKEGLLEGAAEPAWIPSVVSRSMGVKAP